MQCRARGPYDEACCLPVASESMMDWPTINVCKPNRKFQRAYRCAASRRESGCVRLKHHGWSTRAILKYVPISFQHSVGDVSAPCGSARHSEDICHERGFANFVYLARDIDEPER